MEQITVTMIDRTEAEEDKIKELIINFLKPEVWVFPIMNRGDSANQKFMTTQEEDISFQKTDVARMLQ